ncbi:MAG TPA: hypothetical protein VMQ99_23530, partial [Acetobacteraceae bacterium]|nr:hypothetical protein [Acetobacteraceae bacterium]
MARAARICAPVIISRTCLMLYRTSQPSMQHQFCWFKRLRPGVGILASTSLAWAGDWLAACGKPRVNDWLGICCLQWPSRRDSKAWNL